MGVALNECGLVPFEQTIAEIDSARELGVPIVMHTGCNWGSSITEGIAELDHHGLLGPDQVHVHCNTLDERDLTRLASHDCKVSASPETELQMGMGHPVIGRALELGMRPSLSCDIVSASSGDMFAQMRIGLQFERCMRNDAFNARNRMPDRLDADGSRRAAAGRRPTAPMRSASRRRSARSTSESRPTSWSSGDGRST